MQHPYSLSQLGHLSLLQGAGHAQWLQENSVPWSHSKMLYASKSTRLTRNRFQMFSVWNARVIQQTLPCGQRFRQLACTQMRKRWAPMLRLWNWSRLGLNQFCPAPAAPVSFCSRGLLADRPGGTRKSGRVWSHGYNDIQCIFHHLSTTGHYLDSAGRLSFKVLCHVQSPTELRRVTCRHFCHS